MKAAQISRSSSTESKDANSAAHPLAKERRLNGAKRYDGLESKSSVRVAYSTSLGGMLVAKIEEALDSKYLHALRGQIDLMFTSPPFPLVRKKEYGNKD